MISFWLAPDHHGLAAVSSVVIKTRCGRFFRTDANNIILDELKDQRLIVAQPIMMTMMMMTMIL